MGKKVENYDFAGWATKANLRCSDGRVIRDNAFADCDGKTVPLVWNHDHDSPSAVLGHALLENRQGGVYAYCKFNGNEEAQKAKELVQHGDVNALSIYANHLKQKGSNVIHGAIREVSLVLAGANPGAYIRDIAVAHSDDGDTIGEAEIYTGEYLEHSDGVSREVPEDDMGNESDDGMTVKDVFDTLNEQQKKAVYAIVGEAVKDAKGGNFDGDMQHADDDSDEEGASGASVKDIFNTLNEQQKKAVYIIVAAAVKDAKGGSDDDDEVEHGDYDDDDYDSEEDEEMKHNVFADNDYEEGGVLSHSDMDALQADSLADAKRFGSLRDSIIAHADQEYGIKDIEMLFPDARAITNTPEFIKRESEWVGKVMNGVHPTPFSRIKSVFADITADEARAKGYIKGKLKKEEVFSLLKRETTPTTVYKKQKMDRDDVIDITDFDVLAWIKGEMRIMLDEELARAYVYGDGRLASDGDKINENNIRPIVSDSDLFTIKKDVTATTAEDIAKTIVDDTVVAMDDYRGSGNPVGLIRQDIYTRCLLLKDGQGYRLYKTPTELATAMMVKELIPVPNDIAKDNYLVVVNLNDYSVGADKGGKVSMFDDFDLDYNQMKYLIETRNSGALTKPYSAIVFKKKDASTGA